jgi:hypothetical protein
MTGRSMGYCMGNDLPEFESRTRGYGRGHGGSCGQGRRMRYRFEYDHGSFSDEIAPKASKESLLENEATMLKDRLASVEKQLSELKKEKN